MTLSRPTATVLFDGSPLVIEQIVALSRGHARAVLSQAPAFEARIRAGADFVDALLRDEGVIYGVTTGYGDSVTVAVPPALVAELPQRLYTFHGCGMGRMLAPDCTRAVLAARLASLAQGMNTGSHLTTKMLWTMTCRSTRAGPDQPVSKFALTNRASDVRYWPVTTQPVALQGCTTNGS